jgi:GTPase
VSARNRTPRKFEPGRPGEYIRIRMEMKSLADVGLVGRPNAGKSTLLSALTRANPRIADYPFSTLRPGLGVVPYGIYQRFVIADIPGLAEGAVEGKGLGHRFLRHIERTRLVVILIETLDPDYHNTLKKLVTDMSEFSDKLAGLPRIIVRSKADLDPPPDTVDENKTEVKFEHHISAVTGDGLPKLVDMIAEKLGLEKEGEY